MLLTDLVDEILEDVPHCPQIIIVNNMRRIIQDYLRRTRQWEVEFTDISVVPGTKAYTIAVPAQTDAAVNTITTTVVSITEMKKDSLETGGKVTEEWNFDSGVLTFVKDPSQAYTIALKGALQIGNTADAAPDLLYTYCSEAITAGTKWRLQRMKDKEWTNLTGAKENENQYYREVMRGRINKNSEYGTKEIIVARNDWR